jgi:hypothetical protein
MSLGEDKSDSKAQAPIGSTAEFVGVVATAELELNRQFADCLSGPSLP